MGSLAFSGTADAQSVWHAWQRRDRRGDDVLAPGSLNIDLSGLAFIRPPASVFLSVLVRLAADLDYPVEVTCPEQRDPAVYLDRVDFTTISASCGVDVSDFPSVHRHQTNGRFTPLLPFDAFGAYAALDEVADTVGAHAATWMSPDRRKRLYNAVFELGYNVEQHAGITSGVVAAQLFGGQRPCVEFAVGDAGDGIPDTLAQGGLQFANGAAAVRAACETRASRMSESGRGKGLKWITEYADSTGGWLMVLSGVAAVHYRAKCAVRTALFERVPVPGTFVFGSFPTG